MALDRLRTLADRTPARRQRHVDLLRAVAIIAVVTGHWLVAVVTYTDRGLDGYSALEMLTWAHPVTWLFQVMPLFFLVGGFANAASLAAERRRGGDAFTWLRGRSDRLVRPTTALLVTLGVVAVAARAFGADPEQVGVAVWVASIPLWFLAAYVAVVALTPVMYALHRRFGLLVPVLLAALVAAGDVASLAADRPQLAEGGHLFAWLAVHQLGFAWQDGRLLRPAWLAPWLAVGGLGALVLLVTVGPYPVSMVTVPGEAVQNVSPPTVALLSLAAAQTGLALLLRERSERWLHRPRPWLAVIAVNGVILTVFLWHMSALVVAAVALHLAGLLPDPPVDSAAWLWWQIPWLLLLAVVLAVLVALAGRVENRRSGPARPGTPAARLLRPLSAPVPRAVVTVTGVAVTLVGLLGVAQAGRGDHGPFGLPTAVLVTYLLGAGLLRLARAAPAPERSGAPLDRSPADPPSAAGAPEIDEFARHRHGEPDTHQLGSGGDAGPR